MITFLAVVALVSTQPTAWYGYVPGVSIKPHATLVPAATGIGLAIVNGHVVFGICVMVTSTLVLLCQLNDPCLVPFQLEIQTSTSAIVMELLSMGRELYSTAASATEA